MSLDIFLHWLLFHLFPVLSMYLIIFTWVALLSLLLNHLRLTYGYFNAFKWYFVPISLVASMKNAKVQFYRHTFAPIRSSKKWLSLAWCAVCYSNIWGNWTNRRQKKVTNSIWKSRWGKNPRKTRHMSWKTHLNLQLIYSLFIEF